jgi:hypothetical protein
VIFDTVQLLGGGEITGGISFGILGEGIYSMKNIPITVVHIHLPGPIDTAGIKALGMSSG